VTTAQRAPPTNTTHLAALLPPTNTTHLAALLPSYNNHNHCHQITALANFHNCILISPAILSEVFLSSSLTAHTGATTISFHVLTNSLFTTHSTLQNLRHSQRSLHTHTHTLADIQSEHVFKLPHFTRSHVQRNLRLRSTSWLLYAWDIHPPPPNYSPQITPWQRGTLTRNAMPSSHPISNI
jgi:hypothetical protein